MCAVQDSNLTRSTAQVHKRRARRSPLRWVLPSRLDAIHYLLVAADTRLAQAQDRRGLIGTRDQLTRLLQRVGPASPASLAR